MRIKWSGVIVALLMATSAFAENYELRSSVQSAFNLLELSRPKKPIPSITDEPFESIFARLSTEKPLSMQRQLALLNLRYDLSNNPVSGATMTRGKPIQGGVRV